MNQAMALDISRQGMQVAGMVLMPVLAVSLFLGLIISIFQALTQIQEMTLTFVPKLLAVGAVIVLMGNWMLVQLVQFTAICFQRMAAAGVPQ